MRCQRKTRRGDSENTGQRVQETVHRPGKGGGWSPAAEELTLFEPVAWMGRCRHYRVVILLACVAHLRCRRVVTVVASCVAHLR